MRNLKKVLTLVLTVAMVLSIMVVGTGAAFSDQDSIKNTEAVDVCSALNIIGGFPDGSYRPSNNVTRGEMCKMICVLLNGGKEPTLGNNTVSTFTDVRGTSGAWAESYIESCNSQGIVSGVGGGRFNPNGSVTGTQAARMLLVAMGFNADNEKFTGTSWDINVNIRATQKGLYNGIESIDTNAALSRDNAAQMIWNALDAKMVTYKNEFSTGPDGQIIAKPVLADKTDVNNKGFSLLQDKYGVEIENAYMIDASYDSVKKEYTYTFDNTAQFGGTAIDPDDALAVTSLKSTADYSDLFGQRVAVAYKTSDKTLYGIYADESSVVTSGVLGDISTSSIKAGEKTMTVSGTKYTLGDVVEATDVYGYVNGTTNTLASAGGVLKIDDVVASITGNPERAAWTFSLIDNTDDGKGDVMVIHPFSVAKVTYAGSTSITAGTNYKFEDNNIEEGIEKDDYVVIVDSAYTVDGDTAITKADTVSGKITGTKGSPSYTDLQVDSTWYGVAATITNSVDDSCDFAVVNGYIFAADLTAEGAKDILFLSARDNFEPSFGESTAIIDAKAFLPGDKDTTLIKVEKLEGKKIANSSNADTKYVKENTLTPGLYTFSKNSAGNYELKALNNTNNKAGYDSYVASAGKFNYTTDKFTTASGLVIPDDAVVYVQNGTTNIDNSVITGKKLKGASADFGANLAQVLVSKSNGIEYAKVIALIDNSAAALPDSSTDTKYAYVVADENGGPFTGTKDDDNVTFMTIWDGTTDEKAVYAKETGITGIGKGVVISYEVESDEEISNVNVVGTNAAIIGCEDKDEGIVNYFYMNGSASTLVNATMDEDVVIIGIDSKDSKSASIERGDIVEAGSKTDGYRTYNAIVVTSGTKVLAIFYDVANELDISNNEIPET